MSIDDLADEALAEDPPEDHEQREPWLITSDGEATWAMGKYRDAVNRVEEVRRLARAEIERLERWEAAELAQPERDSEFFGAALTRYAIDVRTADEARKHVSTPQGRVSTRFVPATLGFVDRAVATDWARTHLPAAVETVEHVDLRQMRNHFVETGEVPAGMDVGEARYAVTITPAPGSDPSADVPRQGGGGGES